MFSLLMATYVVAAGTTFKCTPTAVWDGDGPIWCAEGPKIRLAGIAAREMSEECRSNQPCPKASGHQARNYLVTLLGGARGTLGTGHIVVKFPPLKCLSEGNGKGERTAAWCVTVRGDDLSCAMIRSRNALRWDRYRGAEVCYYPRWTKAARL